MLDEILSLPLEQKIGQLFFIGIAGPDFDDGARELCEEISPGGVCLFSRNIRESDQTRKLLDDIRGSAMTAPFLSLDQEGGLVDRLRRILEPMPAANLLKAPADAATLGRITAEALRILGFNVNFAPVVDVVNADRGRFSNGLFSRAFGATREDVVAFSTAYLDSLQAGGIIGTVKHFPGLGATEIDSHEELPVVRISQDEFFETDLFPYAQLSRPTGVECVMIAHAAFPKLDLQETDASGRLLPSSLSFNFTTKLLRDTLGFEGLALTDDLEMGAIVKNYGIGDACKLAIKAGQDQLLICNDADAVRTGFAAVKLAVESGEIDISRIDLSLHRIAATKNLMQPPLEFDQSRLNELSNEISDLKAKLK